MRKPKDFNRDLILVALLTSVVFGVFNVLPILISEQLTFLLSPRPQPPGGFGMPPPRPQINVLNNMAVVTGLMLLLWIMNIFLYFRLNKLQLKEKTKNVTRYLISFGLTLVMVAAYLVCLAVFRLPIHRPAVGFFSVVAVITNNIIVLIVLDLVMLQRQKAQIVLENTQLKMNSIIAQHQQLKHQLQPHFLFNSLSTLKTLIKRQPREAEDYLVRLSDFLRSSISANDKHTFLLKEELKLCTDYLEMQRVRFKKALDFKIEVPDEILSTAYLPVFSLQLLVENAIKHNAFTTDDPLLIKVVYRPNGTMVVSNNKSPKKYKEPSSGIGLKNLKERYRVISDQGINIMDSDNCFSVELKLLEK